MTDEPAPRRWRLSRCDPWPNSAAPDRWQIGFDILDDPARPLHMVTTVYAADLEQPSSKEAAIAAARQALEADHDGPPDSTPATRRKRKDPHADHD